MGKIKDKNDKVLREVEEIKKKVARIHRTVQKSLNDWDNHDGVVSYLESDILEYELTWAFSSVQFSHSIVSDSL